MRGSYTFILISLGILAYADQTEASYLYTHHISYLNMTTYEFIADTSLSQGLGLFSNDIKKLENDSGVFFILINYNEVNTILLIDMYQEQKMMLDSFIEILLHHEYDRVPFDFYPYYNSELSEKKFTEVKQLSNLDAASDEQFISETAAINLVLTTGFLSLIIHRLFLLYELKTRKLDRSITDSSLLF